jgi:hypothetical protein
MMRVKVIRISVSAAGVPVSGPAVKTKKFTLVALQNNGLIFYGGPDMDAVHRGELVGKEQRDFVAPGNEELELSELRFDATVNGEGVEIIYYEHY